MHVIMITNVVQLGRGGVQYDNFNGGWVRTRKHTWNFGWERPNLNTI